MAPLSTAGQTIIDGRNWKELLQNTALIDKSEDSDTIRAHLAEIEDEKEATKVHSS